MNIVIAPDSFKGSNGSLAVAQSIEKGLKRAAEDLECSLVPVADGGEGTVEAMIDSVGGSWESLTVTGPMGADVQASYGILSDKTAVIEMASASGLPLVPEEQRDPGKATTRGTGELVLDALDKGCRKIVLGIGGSATNDGGTGLARALGYRFLDAQGKDLPEGGAALSDLASIDSSQVDGRVQETTFHVACDVSNPLLGETGASYVYGPQKGASEKMVQELDSALAVLADLVKKDLGIDEAEHPGAGAAGGLGYGLLVFCSADLARGIDVVLDAIDFNSRIAGADLVITGEGKIDGQSIYGKVPVGVAERAQAFSIPVLVIAGDIGEGIDVLYKNGIDSLMSTVNRAMPLSEAMARGSELLVDAAERAMRMINIGRKIGA